MGTGASANRRAAKLEVLQGASGAFLTLFLLFHLHFEASILFGQQAFDAMAGFLHASWADPAGHGYNWLVTVAAVLIGAVVALHVYAVARKVPLKLKQYQILRKHMQVVDHGGTRLWLVQLGSGIGMVLLIPIHLLTMALFPENIGAVDSAARITYSGGWLLYGLLLPLAVVHATAGMTRLWLKWCPISEPRFIGRKFMRGVTIYLLLLGCASILMHTYYGLTG